MSARRSAYEREGVRRAAERGCRYAWIGVLLTLLALKFGHDYARPYKRFYDERLDRWTSANATMYSPNCLDPALRASTQDFNGCRAAERETRAWPSFHALWDALSYVSTYCEADECYSHGVNVTLLLPLLTISGLLTVAVLALTALILFAAYQYVSRVSRYQLPETRLDDDVRPRHVVVVGEQPPASAPPKGSAWLKHEDADDDDDEEVRFAHLAKAAAQRRAQARQRAVESSAADPHH